MTATRVLYVVVCGAGPAGEVGQLIQAAQKKGWQVHVIATPAGLGFLDLAELERQTGHPVRSTYRSPNTPRRSATPADVIIVAPATFNTINKLAAGVADNYALGLLAECIGLGVPVIVVPFINTALAGRAPLQSAVATLRAEGVKVMLGPGGFEPHPAGQGGERVSAFPWIRALAEAAAAVDRPRDATS